jgi:putative transposase
MSDEMMDLQSLVEKAPDADFLRAMIGYAAKRLMELEVGALTNAAWGEKDPARLVQRNGYRGRTWVSTAAEKPVTRRRKSLPPRRSGTDAG